MRNHNWKQSILKEDWFLNVMNSWPEIAVKGTVVNWTSNSKKAELLKKSLILFKVSK